VANLATAALLPTAMILLPLIAKACTKSCEVSEVKIFPFIRIRSADCAAIFVRQVMEKTASSNQDLFFIFMAFVLIKA
jgi:hypothetical protein